MASWTLGIDPSASKHTESSAIGWALFRDKELIETGELTPDPPYFSRVRQFCRNKFKTIYIKEAEHKILVAVESVYYGANPAVFLGLIQCQSHICAATLDAGHSFRFVSPMDSFKAATGLTQYPLNDKGKRSGTRKPTIRKFMIAKYGLSEDVSEHQIDAIAICEAILQGK